MSVDKKAVGARIRLIRQSKGLTLEEFGNFFNASKGNVSLWEKGSSLPSNERIKHIASIGDMTVSELLHGNSDDRKNIAEELNVVLNEVITNKKNILGQEIKLLTESGIEGLLQLIGKGQGRGEKAVKEYEEHRNRIEKLEAYGKDFIKNNFSNYSYENYLESYPNSNLNDFNNYKTEQIKKFRILLEDYWVSFESLNQYYYWINKRFTDQISDILKEIENKGKKENNTEYYINEIVQPFFDKTAKDFKNYIEENIDFDEDN